MPHSDFRSSHPASRSRLAQAVATVPLSIPVRPPATLPEPATTRLNLPQPATANSPAQNEPTPADRARIRQRIAALIADAESAINAADFNPHPPKPAQTRQKLPDPATPHTPAQNEATLTSALSPRQLHAARLLVAGHTAKSIASQLGINRHTVSDWKHRPDFQHELARILKECTLQKRSS